MEAEEALFVEVESVAEDVQVSHAAGDLDVFFFGFGVLFGHHVVFAGVVTRALVAGSGVLAVSELFLELFPLFPHVLDVLAGVAVCLDDLFERDAGVDLGGVLVRPVGFEGGVMPVVEWLLEVATAPMTRSRIIRPAVMRWHGLMEVSSGSGSCM